MWASRHQRNDAPVALSYCDPFAKAGQERFGRRSRRFKFMCSVCQCPGWSAAALRRALSRREMAEQCSQPKVGPAGNIAHRYIGPVLGNDVTRDCEEVAVNFFSALIKRLDKWIDGPYIWISDPNINGSAVQ